MAPRSGSLDPSLVLHLVHTSGLDVGALGAALTERAGLAGLAGGSGDMREVLAARAVGDPEAATAMGIYLHRLRREIAAAAVSLDTLDALVLTGTVVEGSPWLRSELVAGLGLLGARLDRRRNREASHDAWPRTWMRRWRRCRTRPLDDAGPYTVVWVNALEIKVREEGWVVGVRECGAPVRRRADR